MRTNDALIDELVAAIEAVEGLRPAVPFGLPDTGWLPWDRKRAAVEANSALIELRVVATALPLPPLLDRLTERVRAVLAAAGRPDVALRVTVTELDAAAFREPNSGNRTVT
ncbi:hypothetical protein ACWDSJ_29155 [Nocardia sp. NPDC003482]